MTDEELKNQIANQLGILKKNLGGLKEAHPDLDTDFVENAISSLKGDDTVEVYKGVMAMPKVSMAFGALKGTAEANKIYSSLGITPTVPIVAPNAPVNMTLLATRLAAATAKGDQAEIAKITAEMAASAQTEDGKLNPAVIAGGVGVVSKFLLGSDVGESAKYSALAALATMAWNWYNSEDGQKTISGAMGGLGNGADGVMGGISKLFAGGADGVGGIMGALGDTFSSITDNPKLSGLLDTVLGFVKDQPLVAAAVGYGLYAMFGNGFSLGGIFSGMSTAMLAMAVAWIAESVLDLDGPGRNHEIVRDVPKDLPSQSPSALPIPAAVPGDMQVL